MKKYICIMLSAFLMIGTTTALATSNEETLALFAAEIRDLQEQTGFLTRWSEADQTELIELINRYGLYGGSPVSLEQYLYPDPSTILQDAFISVYGDAAFWTLEQANRRDTLLVSLGLQDTIYHVLPAEGELTPQEALDIAYDAIVTNTQYFHYSTDALDTYRVSLQYVQYENAPLYLVHYYLPDRMLLIFDIAIQQNGASSFSYWDPLSMRNIYQDWYFARDFTRFIRWSLPDKQAFYKLLLDLFEHQMECYGGLPPIGKTVLAHVHSVPAETDLQPDEALLIALQVLQAQSIDVSALTATLSFYRDTPGAPSYEVAWVDTSDITQYAVIVDAIQGTGSLGTALE